MKVAVIHNLARGGARRRLEQQLQHVRADIVEICLSQALPVTDDPIVVPDPQLAPAARRLIRPPFRYLDLATLTLAWMRVAVMLRRVRPDVIFANPCQLLQAPAALIGAAAPSLYFCDEPRATESDPRVRLLRNDSTRAAYAALYAAARLLDRAATLRATVVATNSRHTAAAITAVYGRTAAVLPMGVPESFTPTFEPPAHLLSVASLTPDKGHELVLRAAAAARSNWPVVIVAPRPDPSARARPDRARPRAEPSTDDPDRHLRRRAHPGIPQRGGDALPGPPRAVRTRVARSSSLRIARGGRRGGWSARDAGGRRHGMGDTADGSRGSWMHRRARRAFSPGADGACCRRARRAESMVARW